MVYAYVQIIATIIPFVSFCPFDGNLVKTILTLNVLLLLL